MANSQMKIEEITQLNSQIEHVIRERQQTNPDNSMDKGKCLNIVLDTVKCKPMKRNPKVSENVRKTFEFKRNAKLK